MHFSAVHLLCSALGSVVPNHTTMPFWKGFVVVFYLPLLLLLFFFFNASCRRGNKSKNNNLSHDKTKCRPQLGWSKTLLHASPLWKPSADLSFQNSKFLVEIATQFPDGRFLAQPDFFSGPHPLLRSAGRLKNTWLEREAFQWYLIRC